MEPLTPELALRLAAYLRSHPERSVLWRPLSREWVFTDDEPGAEAAVVPEADLSGYLPC